MTEPRHVVIARDGLGIAGLDWGGDGPDLLLLHPNGFTAGVFEPIARQLQGRYRCLAVDLRGHGRSETPASVDGFELREQAADVVAWLDRVGVGQVRCVGASLGGVVATLVDLDAPGRISRMLLAEPVIFPPNGSLAHNELGDKISAMTAKREFVWADRSAMSESLFGRGGYTGMGHDTFEAFVRWGTVERSDGRIELACSPESEAAVFAITHTTLGSHPAWEHLTSLNAATTLVAGTSSFLPAPLFDAQAERAGLQLERLDGGHLILFEDTERAASLIATTLTGRGR